jgi:transposase-like protein
MTNAGKTKKTKKPSVKSASNGSEVKQINVCPYCKGTKIVKSGFRKKKLEKIQVFYCKHCDKKFTPIVTKNRTYPVAVILQSLISYNRFETREKITEKLKDQYGLDVSIGTIINWVNRYEKYLPFLRMREFLAQKLNNKKARLSDYFFENRLFHKQIYDFKYHRAKLDILIEEDYKNFKLRAIKEFLELSVSECPHQVFKESNVRSSEYKNCFNLDEVRITRKNNRACEMAKFVMQAIANNKLRHEKLQEFMIFCDSTTVATEVPVLLDNDDIQHFKKMLNYKVPVELKNEEDVITGHIDIVQLRNGMIHILDFKPSASKEKPVDQLTIYALALSRLTGLRLYHFKCAWFDEDDYYEFYPLHVVYKKRKKK